MSQTICNDVLDLSYQMLSFVFQIVCKTVEMKGRFCIFGKSNSLCKQKIFRSLSELKKKKIKKLPSRTLVQINWVNYLL